MRNLKTSDIFSACRLITKIGIREEVQEVAKRAEESNTKKIKMDLGFDLFFGIIEKATKKESEEEIYKFIGDILECEWEVVRDMDPIELLDKLEEVANVEKWKNFFGRVAKLMKSM